MGGRTIYKHPTRELVGMSTVVEMDEKGRILLPREMRKNIRSRRFEVSSEKDVIKLVPLPDVESLRGKYRKLIKYDWNELEERAERFVAIGKR